MIPSASATCRIAAAASALAAPTDLEAGDTFGSFFSRLFTADFMPHGHCFFWRGEIVWLHVVSDLLIALAYFSIPLMLVYFSKKRRDLPYPWMFALFAGFIFWCGTTHIMNIVTLWIPIYRAEGLIKLATASISVATAILLFPLIPQALSLRSARELEQKNQELEKAYQQVVEERAQTEEERSRRQELEKFTHVASHDLREPLRTISLFSELLIQESAGKLEPTLAEYLAQVSRNAKRMEILIADLISYSRVDSPQDKQEILAVDECIRRAAELLAMAVQENDAEIDYDVPTGAQIQANPTQISQLFQNLISNALKFRRNDLPPRIGISVSRNGKEWLFAVRDNGIGFAPEYKNEIFLLFRRLHKNETYPGTGMGLALCKKIVEQHRGRIWAESKPGEGSVFYFTLPFIGGIHG